MDYVLRYRGKNVTVEDVEFIGELIAQNPQLSRRRLSERLAQAWNWVQANGVLRSMVCRSLMLQLHRAGHIELPPVRRLSPNPLAQRRKPAPLDLRWDPVEGTVRELAPFEIRQVRRTPEEKLLGSLIQAHHYLAYTQPVGEHLKYLIYARGTPVACMAWSSAPRHLGARDQFIGWDQRQRRAHIHLLAYNTRFLILPWARNIACLASHLLARVAAVISGDWQRLYHHPVHLLETFIDPGRFRATCYRAANWQLLGLTTGRGKNDLTKKPNRPLKQLWVLPLAKDFRTKLGATPYGTE